jgi:outer membrane protein assembly factor BamB
MRRLLGALAAVLALNAGGAAVAGGAAPAAITLSIAVGPPTTGTTVDGAGFGPSELVDVALDGTVLDTVLTRPFGTFLAEVTVPGSALPGPQQMTATGRQSGRTASTTFLVRTDWAQEASDPARSGFNRYENVLTPDTVDGLELAWVGRVPGAGRVISAPAIAHGMVLMGAGDLDGNHVDPVSAWPIGCTTGGAVCEPLWSVKPAVLIYGQVAVVDDVVVAGGRRTLVGLDLGTGAERWRLTGIPNDNALVVDGGTVFVVSGSTLLAVDAATGTRLWKHRAVAPSFGGMAARDGRLFVKGGDMLRAFSADDGHLLWQAGPFSTINATPVVAGGIVYLAPFSGGVRAFDAATGAPVWTTDPRGETQDLAVDDEVVWAGGGGGVQSFDRATGRQESQFTNGLFHFHPIVAGDVAYAIDPQGRIVMLDASTPCRDCEPLAVLDTGMRAEFLAVADGYLYVAGNAGTAEVRAYSVPAPTTGGS